MSLALGRWKGLGGALLALAMSGNFAPAQIQLNGTEAMDIRRDATVTAVEKVMPSVVNIATKNVVPRRDPFADFYLDFLGRQSADQPFSLGSGVVIDEAGYLLTNDHVVQRADKIAVKFAGSGEVYDATVVATDANSDVALLKINGAPGQKFQAIKLAPEDDLLLGETVLALGNPFGLGGSVSRGILSSKTRRAPKDGEPLVIQDCLQTDAAINPGNSGGPLVNLRGELIGLNVQYVPGGQSIGFAIPIKKLLAALGEIYPGEFLKSYWFGARVKAGSYPLRVTYVQPESPAARAGLRAGDAILLVNNRAPRSFIDFADKLVAGASADEQLLVQRGLERVELTLRLVPERDVFNASMIQSKLGLGVERGPDGFTITDVQTNSPAGAAGLQSGMLIRQVNEGTLPSDVTGFAKILHGLKKGETVRLGVAAVRRNGRFNVLLDGSVELAPR
ncbi:MAG: trypsin-like peptidase domain-containing protein [Verrucomicrobiota bacterium]